MTSQSKTPAELSALLSKTISLAHADPAFAARLQGLIADQEVRQAKLAQAAEYAQELRSNPADLRATQLCKLAKRSELYYSPQEWVPSEFETMERLGFVHCSFGHTEFAGVRRARTITPTEAGLALAAELELLLRVAEPTPA